MAKSVLALGLDPVHADYSQMPSLTPELVRAPIEAQLDRVRALGYTVEAAWLTTDATADRCRARATRGADVRLRVMFGAGLRAAPQLLLFERLINLMH